MRETNERHKAKQSALLCTKRYISWRQWCGARLARHVGCRSPFCVGCERKRAEETWARYGLFVQGLKHPKMLVLSLPSTDKAKPGLTALKKAFSRFRNMRFGGRARARLLREVNAFLDGCDISEKRRMKEYERVEMFLANVGKAKRVVDVLGPGLAALEVTLSKGKFHWHYHILFSALGKFLPWGLLSVLWQRASGEKHARIHIERLRKDGREVLKYVCKPGSVPVSKQQDVINALHGVRRLRPFGGAKPAKIQKPCCVVCGDPACKRSVIEHMRLMGGVLVDGAGDSFSYVKRGNILILTRIPFVHTTTDSATEDHQTISTWPDRVRAGGPGWAGP